MPGMMITTPLPRQTSRALVPWINVHFGSKAVLGFLPESGPSECPLWGESGPSAADNARSVHQFTEGPTPLEFIPAQLV